MDVEAVNADLIRCLSAAGIIGKKPGITGKKKFSASSKSPSASAASDQPYVAPVANDLSSSAFSASSKFSATLAASDLSPIALNDSLVDFLENVSDKNLLFRAIGIEILDGNFQPIDGNANAIVAGKFALDGSFAPISLENGTLTVAVADPFAVELFDSISRKLDADVVFKLTSFSKIRNFLQMSTPPAEKIAPFVVKTAAEKPIPIVNDAAPKPMETPMENESPEPAEEEPVLLDKFFEDLLTAAIRERASDVHLENMRDGMRIRIRIDGKLHTTRTVDKILAQAVVAKVKISADAKIDEARLPQDRRIRMCISQKNYDLRISILPTIYGENIAIRIFDQGDNDFNLDSIGLRRRQFALVETMVNCRNGLVLLCGPTGCGKTTTLYTILKRVSSRERKVITIEDPIEYRLDGISQVPVNDEIGLSFATILRSVLRQSPNIIMVGEIRDSETAELAIQAALTGHLVFSTVHCNDSTGAITRLLDFKISKHLIKNCLRGAISQKLMRRPCEKCAVVRKLSASEKALSPWKDLFLDAIPEMRGCESCLNRGYKGRIAAFDFLVNGKLVPVQPSAGKAAILDDFIHIESFADSAMELLRDGLVVFEDVQPFLR
jgi:type II secretory ATPase GspE/PulE/Tfp pilus assembly ATPase PilB-like protein